MHIMRQSLKYKQFLLQALAQKREKSKGFTLVELMIVVAIIGVLLALLLPNLIENRQRADAQSRISTIDTFAKQCSVNMLNENPNPMVVGAVLNVNGFGGGNVAPAVAVAGPPQTKQCGYLDAQNLFINAGTAFSNSQTMAASTALNGLICGRDSEGTPRRFDFVTMGSPGTVFCVMEVSDGIEAEQTAPGVTVLAGQAIAATPLLAGQVTGYWSSTAVTSVAAAP